MKLCGTPAPASAVQRRGLARPGPASPGLPISPAKAGSFLHDWPRLVTARLVDVRRDTPSPAMSIAPAPAGSLSRHCGACYGTPSQGVARRAKSWRASISPAMGKSFLSGPVQAPAPFGMAVACRVMAISARKRASFWLGSGTTPAVPASAPLVAASRAKAALGYTTPEGGSRFCKPSQVIAGHGMPRRRQPSRGWAIQGGAGQPHPGNREVFQ